MPAEPNPSDAYRLGARALGAGRLEAGALGAGRLEAGALGPMAWRPVLRAAGCVAAQGIAV
ncbi:MAG: hypothetical protein KKA32_03875 [Actinobacteria bacterium]|nr:hypothetical protein [Actinomycetota bacterium]